MRPSAPASGRALYQRADLLRLVSPRSVAIVGASGRTGSFGNRAMLNLGRFDGDTYLVNARYEQIDGRPCYPDLASLPSVPDCVFIAVGREAVEATLEQCAALGVGGAVVVASGYGETGKPDRRAAQDRLTAIARGAGLRLAGPNTIGLVNYATGAGMTFSPMPDPPAALPAHAIGVVSQSGSLGFALAQAMEGGAAVSHVLTSGNSCDVDVADYVAFLAEDPTCRAIACVFEGMADPGRMLDAAERAWAADKPLILYKMATGTAGAEAALSHTGSLAGSDQAYRAAFARRGVVQVDRFDALMETAAFFAKAGRPAATGVAVIATSGGTAIMAADKAEAHGLALPQPGVEAAAVLAARIPEYGSPRNPCDVTAQVLNDADGLTACMDALLGDPGFGTLVTSYQYAYDLARARIPVLSEAGRRQSKIVCSV